MQNEMRGQENCDIADTAHGESEAQGHPGHESQPADDGSNLQQEPQKYLPVA